jgi:hypothetical protein
MEQGPASVAEEQGGAFGFFPPLFKSRGGGVHDLIHRQDAALRPCLTLGAPPDSPPREPGHDSGREDDECG